MDLVRSDYPGKYIYDQAYFDSVVANCLLAVVNREPTLFKINIGFLMISHKSKMFDKKVYS